MKYFGLDHRARAVKIIKLLQTATIGMVEPAASSVIEQFGKDPFLILISCILSLRTKDTVSLPASQRLFECATTPQELLALPLPTIQKLIYPVGFYRRKAHTVHAISRYLIENHAGRVPATAQELLKIPGVGIKTAHLVLGLAFDVPALCVDTHVHRISNRLGLVSTKTVEQTEQALQAVIPQDSWIEYNRLMVIWGQNVCVPISPKCSQCVLFNLCPRVGVVKHR